MDMARLRTILQLSLIGISIISPPCPADTYPRQPGIDAIHYTFRLTLRDDTDEIEGESTVNLRFLQDGVKEFTLDLASAASGKGMAVSGVTSRGAAVKYEHKDDRLRITVDPPLEGGRAPDVHRGLSRRPFGRPADRQEPARRPDVLQRQLARQGAAMAADGQPSLRQGHQRIPRHGPGALPGGVQRPDPGGDGPRRRPTAHALEAVGADRLVAECRGRRPVHVAPRRHRQGRPARDVGLSIRIATRGPGPGEPRAPRAGILLRAHRPVSLREARRGAGRGDRRRDGGRQRDLLRRALGLRPGRGSASSPTRSRTSGSATPSPSATGTTSGSARASPPISPCSSSSTTPAAMRSSPA